MHVCLQTSVSTCIQHMLVCIHTYMYQNMYTYRLMDVCACTYTCMYHMNIHTYLHGDSCMPNLDIQTHMFAYKHAYIHMSYI